MNRADVSSQVTGPGQSIPWFQNHLTSRAHPIILGSKLAREIEFTNEFARSMRGDRASARNLEELLERFMRAAGMDALTKSLHRAHGAGYAVPDDRLRGLVRSNPNPFVAAENQRERNKAWELFVAAQMAQIGKVEHDERCDLVAQIQDKRVAIAAKVPYSGNDEQVWKCLLDGVEQAARLEDVDADLVVANYVQRLDDRATIFRRSHQMGFRFSDQEIASEWAQQAAIEICECRELRNALTRIERWTREGKRPKRPVGVVFFMPVVVSVEGGMMLFAYPHMPITSEHLDFEVVTRLCEVLSDVLKPVNGGHVQRDVAEPVSEVGASNA